MKEKTKINLEIIESCLKPEINLTKAELISKAECIYDSNSVALAMLPSVARNYDLLSEEAETFEHRRNRENAQSSYRTLLIYVTNALKNDIKHLEASVAAKLLLVFYYHNPAITEDEMIENFLWFLNQKNFFETI